MINEVISAIKKNKEDSDSDSFVIDDISKIQITEYDQNLINSIVKAVKDPLFASNFLDSSYNRGVSSFTIENDVCYVYSSMMVNDSFNLLLGKVRNVNFVILQHVSSCDFIYFPSYNYINIVEHSNIAIASSILKTLADKYSGRLNSDSKMTELTPMPTRGLLLSHERPYHFFYDTAVMSEYLYQQQLLDKFSHYQIKGSDFIDFSSLYKLGCKSITTDFNELNKLSKQGEGVFFKVGVMYPDFKRDYFDTVNQLDKRLIEQVDYLNINHNILDALKKLKKDNNFLLWFGVSTDKRSLANQVELAISLIESLSSLYDVSVAIDGWTIANHSPLSTVTSNREHENLSSDQKVFNEIKKHFENSAHIKFFSLIGETSATKIAVSNLINFYVTSGATGSLWPSRIGRSEGILHSSRAFYYVQNAHIYRGGIDFPNQYVEDVMEKVQRVDYTSYNIKKEDFLAFIKNSYPNIFNGEIHLKRFNVKSLHDLETLDAIENSLKSLTNDPQINIDINSLIVDDITVPFTLHLTCYIEFANDNLKHLCKFYLDYGSGFNEKQVIEYSIENGEDYFEVDIEVTKPLKGIRFDPTDMKDINFNFKGLFYSLSNINN